MGNEPLRIGCITMKTSTNVVVDTTFGHGVQRLLDHPESLDIPRAIPIIKEHRQIRRLWKFRSTTKTAVDGIEHNPKLAESLV